MLPLAKGIDTNRNLSTHPDSLLTGGCDAEIRVPPDCDPPLNPSAAIRENKRSDTFSCDANAKALSPGIVNDPVSGDGRDKALDYLTRKVSTALHSCVHPVSTHDRNRIWWSYQFG
jgi:hypothetical protein